MLSRLSPTAAITFLSLTGLIAAPVRAEPAYAPPSLTAPLLPGGTFATVAPIDEDYRQQFSLCDEQGVFRDIKLPKSRRCSGDKNQVRALLRLKSGAIYWESKMGLDVDGAWAAWNGKPGATDQKFTSLKWPGVADGASQAAQIDPDVVPFIVIPTDGLRSLTGTRSTALGSEFADKTGLVIGDFAVVLYKDEWTPAIIADGGPFERLGEASSQVFKRFKGQDRCKKWSADGQHCIGTGGYPYRDFSIGQGVVFIAFPSTRDETITPQNLHDKLCAEAKAQLGLIGGACP